MSIEPPAPNGMSTRIGLLGQGASARAAVPAALAAATTLPAAASSFRLVNLSTISFVSPVRAFLPGMMAWGPETKQATVNRL
jgi:hypothetical protein